MFSADASKLPTPEGDGGEALPGAGHKAERVREMFSQIAPTYDFLNGLLSFGIDKRWRREAAAAALPGAPAPGGAQTVRPTVLDVACGTGDLALTLAAVDPGARVVGADFAEPMLELARQKAEKRGADVEFRVADGTALPFGDATFDAVTIAYGLRNFADVPAGLREFRRVLRPGGRVVVLEFPPPPKGPFGALFRWYFRRLLPLIGGVVSGQRGAYAYLPDSVLTFLNPDELAAAMDAAGFTDVNYRLQTFGVSALHVGRVPPATPGARSVASEGRAAPAAEPADPLRPTVPAGLGDLHET